MVLAGPLSVEEHVHGDTVWVAVRARGADWSWLTPEEAVRLARDWLDRYAPGSFAAGSFSPEARSQELGAPPLAMAAE